MTNDEKITKWIKEQEAAGKSRDDIARGVFVSKSSDDGYNVYRLSKSGKAKYNLAVHLGAQNLDEMEDN